MKGPRDSARPWLREGCDEILVWGRRLTVGGEDSLGGGSEVVLEGPPMQKGRGPT